MNAEALLKHYERIANAPDAVERLRRFVRELAVRGKLLPQQQDDEPAAVLLGRVASELPRTKPTQSIGDSLPFDAPRGWVWTSLGNLVAHSDAGWSPQTEERPRGESEWGVLKVSAVSWGTFKPEENKQLLPGTEPRLQAKVAKGDFLISRANTAELVARAVIVENEPARLMMSDKIVRLRLSTLCDHHFVLMVNNYAAHAREHYARLASGVSPSMKNVSRDVILGLPFPLPPLAEQHRIVAKVDELMALCDRLEAARVAREATRDRLAAASLARLNTPDPDPETFKAHASFAISTALPALTTRQDQIKQLRQTILNFAVLGQLVSQTPADGTGTELLSKITSGRLTTAKAAGVRLKVARAASDIPAFASLPCSWAVEQLGNLVHPAFTISYGVLVPGPDVDDGIPFVRAQDLALSGHPSKPGKTIAPDIEAPYARTRLRGGEILLCVVGSIGKLGIAPDSWAGANIARAVARISPFDGVTRDYLLIALKSDLMQSQFADATRTVAQPTLNVSLIEALSVPLPPVAEQLRIVAKVNELMQLCDQLETSLHTGADTRRRLLDALLHEALAPLAAAA